MTAISAYFPRTLLGAVALATGATACAPTPRSAPRSTSDTVAAPSDRSTVEVEHDPELGLTKVRLRPPPLSKTLDEKARLLAGALVRRMTPHEVLFGLRHCGHRWRYESCPRLVLRTGGVSVAELDVRREVEVGHGYLREYLLALVPVETLETWARHPSSSIETCAGPLHVDPTEREDLQRFITQLRETALAS